jgi:hypothetical protein
MRILAIRTLLLALLFLVGTAALSAQVIPTGRLVGTVTDPEGQALPGAAITISSPSLIRPQLSAVANEKGYYRFVDLPSGTYQVRVEMPGMKTLIREGIIVSAGKTVTLDTILEQSAIQETVTVTGQAPIVDFQSTTTGVEFKELLTTLPTERTFESVYNLAPGMYDSTSHGSDVRSNKYTVDGLTANRVDDGTSAVKIGFNSIEEVVIDTGGHKAEYGSVRGGVIQVLTKSGGNAFHGEANFYFRNKSMQSDNTKGTPFEGSVSGFDYEYLPGFSLGGPIIKDKIWFFLNFDMRRQNSFELGYPYGGEENTPINKDFYSPFGKVTWQLDAKNKIVASGWWRGDYTDHYFNGPAPYLTTLEGSSIFNNYGLFVSGQWSHIFSDNFLFDLRGGYYKDWNDMQSKTKVQNTIWYPEGYKTSSGEEYFIDTYRIQANAVGTYFLDDWFGGHEIKVGGDYDFTSWHNWYNFYEEPRFVDAYEPGYRMYELYYWDGVPYMAIWFQDVNRKVEALTLSGFVQDTWTPSRSLTLSLGLRYEFIQGRYPRQLVPGSSTEYLYEKTEHPVTWNTLSPRLGVSYAPFKDGRTVLKAGYGRYVAPLNLDYISYAMKGGFAYFLSMLNPDFTEMYRIDESTTADILFDPDAKAPYGDEINFSIQRELMADFAFSLTYMQKWEKRLLQRVDSNGINVELLKTTGQTEWIGYHIVEGTDPMTGETVQFYEQNSDKLATAYYHTNVPGTARTYRGIEAKLTKRLSHNWALVASYVYSKGEGILSTTYDDTWTTTNLYVEPNFTEFYRRGLLEHQRPHYFKLQGTYLAPWGFSVSANFQYFSGEPFTRQLRSVEAGLSLYQGSVRRNAEPRGSSKTTAGSLLDLRIQKDIRLPFGMIELIADLFNVFNSNRYTSYGTRTNIDYMEPLTMTPPRVIRLGIAVKF